LPPEALEWLMVMLDQAPPIALELRVAAFQAPSVPGAVLATLTGALAGVARAYVVGAQYEGGRRGQMLVLTGVEAGAEGKVLRAVTEALAFSGLDASAVDTVFRAAGDALLGRLAGVALVLEGEVAAEVVPEVPAGPGMDPGRPPILK
jgi:hypothetical protein